MKNLCTFFCVAHFIIIISMQIFFEYASGMLCYLIYAPNRAAFLFYIYFICSFTQMLLYNNNNNKKKSAEQRGAASVCVWGQTTTTTMTKMNKKTSIITTNLNMTIKILAQQQQQPTNHNKIMNYTRFGKIREKEPAKELWKF